MEDTHCEARVGGGGGGGLPVISLSGYIVRPEWGGGASGDIAVR